MTISCYKSTKSKLSL